MFVNKYPFSKKPSSIIRLKRTLDTWEHISNSKGIPYDCSIGFITMQPVNFKKFFAGEEVSVSRNRDFVIYSMWHVNGTEVCCMFKEEKEELFKL